MLIIKVFVNNQQIVELRIHNITKGNPNIHNYEIIKPKIENVVISHRRASGWMPLVHKVLKYLITNKHD